MKEDEKSLFGKHSNDGTHQNSDQNQKYEILEIDKSERKRKLYEQLEIIKHKRKPNNVINSVISFENEKLLKLVL